jgi:membrane fusion protein, type I secretion system
MTRWDPRPDHRSPPAFAREDYRGNRFGPQGPALIRELRRVQSGVDRGFDSGPRGRVADMSNVHHLRMVERRPPANSADRRFQHVPEGRPVEHDKRADAPARRPARSGAFVIAAVRACRAGLVLSCEVLLRHLRRPPAEDGDRADLAGCVRRDFDDALRTGLRVLLVGGGLAGGWAVLVPLSAAVMVAGTLVVESNVKKIQHQTGGIVAQIPAQDGMHVKEGELLVRLDEVQVRANLQVLAKQLDQTRVRIARLIAERDGTEEPKLPHELATRTDNKDIEELFASETSLFKARASARQNQKELLRGRIAQLEEEIVGLNAQSKSKTAQLELISTELQGVQGLYEKQLVPLMRLTALQRDAARLDGEQGQLISTIAETRSKISEAELQITRIDQDLRAEVMKDLRDAQDKEAELGERIVAARDQLNRIDIRAPTAGVVHQLSVHTIGGVIAPAEVIMEIVPDTDDLQVQAKLQPNDIDQVRVDQKAFVRFSAFNQRTTPQLEGVVSYVSADLSRERQNDAAFYTVKVRIPGHERRRLGNLQLVSGMPAEVFLQAGSRTMMSYLLKPITDQLQRTFSER